jgi:segregation and condensation protein B
MKEDEAKSIIESVLFISGEPVSLDILKEILDLDKQDVERYLKELLSEYALKNSGLVLVEVAGGVQMVTNPDCAPWIKKLLATSMPTRLSQPSLETLAIIAYKQPIIKSEIEAIRGVNSDGVIRTLLERRQIKILGRKEVPGRPLLYGTTREFLQSFGLKDLSELPTLKEFQEMDTPEVSLPEDEGELMENPVGMGEESVEYESEVSPPEDEGEASLNSVDMDEVPVDYEEEPSRQE